MTIDGLNQNTIDFKYFNFLYLSFTLKTSVVLMETNSHSSKYKVMICTPFSRSDTSQQLRKFYDDQLIIKYHVSFDGFMRKFTMTTYFAANMAKYLDHLCPITRHLFKNVLPNVFPISLIL